MKNDELIPLADSQTLAFIDDINKLEQSEEKTIELKKKIKETQKMDNTPFKKQHLKKLYEQLNTEQFKPDYMSLVIDNVSEYKRAYEKGFKINGIKYSRLLATTGGVKGKTIVFTSEIIKPELRRKIENGRNKNKPLVPAKFGAYEALCCSSSIPVSDPKGILVVKDCFTEFFEDVIKIDDRDSDEPKLEHIDNYKIEKNCSDGYGTMTKEQAEIWSKELGLDYTMSGCNTRYSWEKGMLVVFDHIDFAEKIIGASEEHPELYFVEDLNGKMVDIRTVSVILTESMLKLWDSYGSIDDYLQNCQKNKYQFRITKVTPKELENTRNLNYQFIQSYRLSDKELMDLIKPTIDEIYEVLGGDYRKSILFAKGLELNELNCFDGEDSCIKALMVDSRLSNDPFVRTYIHRMLKKKITDAKIGSIRCNGNYQIACGDPFALWQSIYKQEVTGLLKKGEIYSKYWSNRNVDEVACFRAPMTCHNNIRKLKVVINSDIDYWFKDIKTMIMFNCWDSSMDAMNGEDMDGDQNYTTDNKILVENTRNERTIFCIQRKADKRIITEDLLVQANVDSFGDDIGVYTNGITSQFDLQAQYDVDSDEFKELNYRIMCGQLFQQNAIDKTKGIIAKPRPQYWFDYGSNKIKDDDSKEQRELKEFNKRLVADKKPYFMQYIYPDVRRVYKKYITDSNKKCQTEFKLTIEELKSKPNKTTQEIDFLKYYDYRMPVGLHKCLVNKICWLFENEFDSYLTNFKNKNTFDYSILKSSASYSSYIKNKVEKIYKDYCDKLQKYQQRIKRERINDDDAFEQKNMMLNVFKQECICVCPNQKELTNILIDLCYSTNKSKQFVWDMCSSQIIQNLLEKNNYVVNYPEKDENGDILYIGEKYSMKQKQIGEV